MADDNEAERRLTSAREALADAISDARARGVSPGPGRTGRGINSHSERLKPLSPNRNRSASGEDPTPLGAAIKRLLNERGWQQQAAIGSALGRWEEIVGSELAAHARPDGLTDGELVVIADSTAWATQLRLLAANLVKRLNAELGDGTVRRVKVRGPAGPPRQPGAWRTPGSRGPRDTYG
jgi:predicted nucleic acid-binding Zn ribbon protein